MFDRFVPWSTNAGAGKHPLRFLFAAKLATKQIMPKPDTRLVDVHHKLLVEMTTLHARLPSDVENVSEAFERYARIVALMVRSLDVLTRLEQRQNDKAEKQIDPQARNALIRDIEQKLARLTRR